MMEVQIPILKKISIQKIMVLMKKTYEKFQKIEKILKIESNN